MHLDKYLNIMYQKTNKLTESAVSVSWVLFIEYTPHIKNYWQVKKEKYLQISQTICYYSKLSHIVNNVLTSKLSQHPVIFSC